MKPISEWTLEDCDTKEYWKMLFTVATTIKLEVLDGQFLSGLCNSRILSLAGNNKVVINKMFEDLGRYQYILASFDNDEMICAKPIWNIIPSKPQESWTDEQEEAWRFMQTQKKIPGQKIDN